ncbi:MAG: LemA family protein [Candidatus Omnitrophica bacterium]|nr:LemA family protein [Candidatus Omnitrophota bacterium]
MSPLVVLLIILGILFLAAILVYNGLVQLRNRVRNAWSQIDVQLKRRYDLIPNLVETAKGYMQYEKEVLENVTRARAMAMQTQGPEKQAEAENVLSQALKSLFAVVEKYPDLKANQNMMALQEELTSTENRISFARQHYNDQVMRLNTAIESFPKNIIAHMFNFKKEEFFAVKEELEKEPVKVKF